MRGQIHSRIGLLGSGEWRVERVVLQSLAGGAGACKHPKSTGSGRRFFYFLSQYVRKIKDSPAEDPGNRRIGSRLSEQSCLRLPNGGKKGIAEADRRKWPGRSSAASQRSKRYLSIYFCIANKNIMFELQGKLE